MTDFEKELNELLMKYNLQDKKLIKGNDLYVESYTIDDFIIIGNDNVITHLKKKRLNKNTSFGYVWSDITYIDKLNHSILMHYKTIESMKRAISHIEKETKINK